METVVSAQSRQAAFHIGEPSEIATARRASCDLARTLGFNETVIGEVAIAVTEAGTNITKYAGSGEILLRKAIRHDGAAGIEILALDKGPGIPQLSRAMQDGQSTAGSYGIGLGTMERLADQFDIHTAAGQGTAICLSFWCKPDAGFASGCDTGVVCLPAAGAACLAGGENEDEMTFAGVGNTAGCIRIAEKIRHLISRNGIVGSRLRNVQELACPWSSEALLIMHSDGIRTGWDLDLYPGLALLSPALIAAVLYRDFNRGNDDVAVFVCRPHREQQA